MSTDVRALPELQRSYWFKTRKLELKTDTGVKLQYVRKERESLVVVQDIEKIKKQSTPASAEWTVMGSVVIVFDIICSIE